MAIDTTGWTKLPGGSSGEGILQWTGSGGAPATDPATQVALRNALGFSTGAATPATTPWTLTGEGAGGGSDSSALVPYQPGPITTIVNDLLKASIGGTSRAGPGQTLNMFSKGQIPPALQAQYKQNLDQSMADITERMGVVGNRFGTDLARTLADAAGRADVNLSAEAMRNALTAIQEIIGLGTGQSNLEFQGGQNALTRAHEDFLAQNQSSFLSLLPLLLGTA